MAELSGFWTTDGATPEGDQVASYTQANWSTASEIMSACSGFEGVAPGFLNGLAGSVTGANTVAINTGGGMVDGKWFINDASQDVTIPSSAGGTTRIDRIVLRATWASFNVSVTRIAGTDSGSPSAPAITQTSGTTYDIMLYQALVNSSGTVTLTDERVMASPIKARVGGNADNWSTAGTTNYRIPNAFIQFGAKTTVDSGETTITFPIPYNVSAVPFIMVTVDAGTDVYTADISSMAYTGFDVSVYGEEANTRVQKNIQWIAIGPP